MSERMLQSGELREVAGASERDRATARAVTRRDFVAAIGGLGVGAVVAGAASSFFLVSDEVYAIETSDGYLLVDTKKCGACETCMTICSLAHSGIANAGLSRLQLAKNPLGCFPLDIQQNQCRQCPYPACVEACPTGAMHTDEETGVRMVDELKCIGCERCVEACPFTPSRVQWNFEERHAQKCDLCLNTPYWNETGGPSGKRACEEVCPMRAISFTTEVPRQNDDGYDVNLRNEHWAIIGFPIDDAGKVRPDVSVPSETDVTDA